MIAIIESSLSNKSPLTLINEILLSDVSYIILREKLLKKDQYEDILIQLDKISNISKDKIYIAHHIDLAKKYKYNSIHLSYDKFIQNYDNLSTFKNISVSIHSLNEAKQLNSYKLNSLVYGHIFNTDCKKNIKPKGIQNLAQIVRNSIYKVNAIGGINKNNYIKVLETGCNDYCIMSGLMEKENLSDFVKTFSDKN